MNSRSAEDTDPAGQEPAAGLVLYAKHLTKLTDFYRYVLAFDLQQADDDFTQLKKGALELVILQAPAEIARRITIDEPPAPRVQTPIKPVIFVDRISVVRTLISDQPQTIAGGNINDPDTEWFFGSYKVCDGTDNEGNIFQLREFNPAGSDDNNQ